MNQTDDKKISIDTFGKAISKLRTFGFNRNVIQGEKYKIVFELTKNEIQKDSFSVATAFSEIYSPDYILSIDKENLEKLYTAISHYVEIFINLHQYKQFDLLQKKRISETYFNDVLSAKINGNNKKSILVFKEWLEKLVDKILI